jgi:ribosomal protein S27E
MDNQSIVEYEDCDQCGRPAVKEIFPYTHEYIKRCSSCGSIIVQSIEGKSDTKGYGSLYENGVLSVFHHPIEFAEEHQILQRIENDPDAVFLKWSEEEQSLIAVKGKLPQTFEEMYRQQYEEYKSEEELYALMDKTDTACDSCIPFDSCNES